jgi:Family of unknown function (DUF5670)
VYGAVIADLNIGKKQHRSFSMSEARRQNMLATIAAVLIVLWLLGFFAFHVTSALIHVILVVAVILLVLHFMRGSASSA